jgi:hypothetical protein
MKRLILILISLFLPLSSYGETLYCSQIYKGKLFEFKYERQGDVFVGEGSKYVGDKVLDIDYEDDEYLALRMNFKSFGVYLLHFDKTTKQFRNSLFSVNNGISDTGTCELIY